MTATTPTALIARAEKPPADRSGLRVFLTTIGLIVLIALVWEGLKAFGAATGYAIAVGGTTISLDVLTDRQLPHLTQIGQAFVEPAQRNGPPLFQVLLESSLFTLWSAARGFAIGAVIGFGLAILFTQSKLMQGGCLPYVVASQTIPVLAIAPMIVIWMGRVGASDWAVPVITAYLTFFPVTIYTLRGLTSVPPTALELMRSYAADDGAILRKLRLPNALPQIFTALKIAATSSVVGAIIGELPSGFQNGLGIAILNFARYYDQSPARLWATIVAAALLGLLAFALVAGAERLFVAWKRPEAA